jgi:ribonuclease HI
MVKKTSTAFNAKSQSVDHRSADFSYNRKNNHKNQTIFLLFDGLFREYTGCPNAYYASAIESKGGLATYGWVVVQDHIAIGNGYGAHNNFIGATSNAGEYFGLIHGLEALLDMGLNNHKIVIRGDSKTVIEQMQYQARVSSPALVPVFDHAQILAAQFSNLRWHWVPRKYNKASDRLTRRALKQYRMYANQNFFSRHQYQPSKTISEECENPLFGLDVFNTQVEYA